MNASPTRSRSFGRRALTAVLLGLLAGAGPAFAGEQPPASAAAPRSIRAEEARSADGIGYRRLHWQEGAEAGSIHLVTVDPRRYVVRLALPLKQSVGGYPLPRYLYEQQALVAFTGSYLTTFLPATPRGLVKVDDTLRSNAVEGVEFARIVDGIVCFAEAGSPAVTRRQTTSSSRTAPLPAILVAPFAGEGQYDAYPSCLQGGPLLVENGGQRAVDWEAVDQVGKRFASGLFTRAFVAETGDGQVVLGIADPIPLQMLAWSLTEGMRGLGADGLAIKSALNLTGRNTAGLIGTVLGLDAAPLGTVDTLLPNAIIVSRP